MANAQFTPQRIYGSLDVLEAAKRRFRWLFREFETVVVSYSGGKDSIVCFHLALEAARAEGKLPLNVMFLDQEIEWQGTIEMVRSVMLHPDVKPYWLQIPFKLSNSTSVEENWLHVWDPAKEDVWMRKKEPYAYTVNDFGTDRFHHMLSAAPIKLFNAGPANKVCVIGGVRCEESPARTLGLTMAPSWKWATWGKAEYAKSHLWVMYPIYDWTFADVWKAIHLHDWKYNPIYDLQFRHGVPVQEMRISNLHHETAVRSLFHVHVFEGDTWNRAVRRLKGLHMAEKMGATDYIPTECPPMFRDWWEYRDYLLEHLITNPEWRKTMAAEFARQDKKYRADFGIAVPQAHVASIMTNDHEGVKSHAFDAACRLKLKIRNKTLNKSKSDEGTPSTV